MTETLRNEVDRQSSRTLVWTVLKRSALPACCTAFFFVHAFIETDHRFVSMFLVLMGLGGLARECRRESSDTGGA
ncbi:MAG: hypothetical protein RRA94_16665 [Bacteroidota bacterium]|nr:hypothetical protein [Bacteroidota bacterium]